MLWLSRILDRYDAEISAYSEAAEENDDDTAEEYTMGVPPTSDPVFTKESMDVEEPALMVLRVPGRRASEALQSVLIEIRAKLSEEAAGRLEHFLERIIGWDWQIDQQKLGVAFRAQALRAKPGKPPKPMRSTVFFLRPGKEKGPHLVFPIAQPWVSWEGLDLEPFMDRLEKLGCVPGYEEEVDLDLQEHHSAEMFEDLYLVVKDIVADMQRSLAEKYP